MNSLQSEFNNSDNLLSITLYNSGFSKDGEHYARVTRNTVTLENLIAEIINENRGMDPFVIQHSAILLQQQIIKNLSLGKGVNILDLGTMYIGMRGNIKGSKPSASDLNDFVVKFTPSAKANSCVKNLQVDKIVVADTRPQINTITDTWSGKENCITPGKICRINGSRLKLGGASSGLSLIPVDDNGFPLQDKPVVAVPADKITKNTSSYLEFYVPDSLAPEHSYKILLSTSYISKNQSRKSALSASSTPLSIVA